VYNGRFYAIPVEDVMIDIRNLVAAGARHVSFSDADFLNGPSHAMRVTRTMHAEFPELTFDLTAKAEHLLAHASLLPELKHLGCLFVISAIESLSDRTLAALNKNHTAADVERVVALFRDTGLHLRPTLVPFTPWDTTQDYLTLLDFIRRERLQDSIDPVQLSIRLLVPPGSLLLSSEDMRPHLTSLDRENLSWGWRHPEPAMDALQKEVAAIAHDAIRSGEDALLTFRRIEQAAGGTVAADSHPLPAAIRDRARPPRLTESWFC
jgi:radical SAM superfamily enzyme YgiQ (UPF0313 family)